MSFEDIKGQDRAIRILRASLRSNRIFSSYLFVGPDGIGKFETAKNFAKAVNCSSEKNPTDACETCPSCKRINSRAHPDIFFVTPKGISSSIGIDEIRSVISKANLKPYEAKKKVFIIDNAHSMNNASSNAFLKTLEEAPKDTIFILISRSKELLLPTIVSRCHVIKFFTAPSQELLSVLMEKFNLKENEAKILNNFSSSRIGEAIRMKDRDLIKRKNRVIDSLLGIGESASDFSEEIANYNTRDEFKENLEFIISFFRDVFLYKTMSDENALFHADKIAEIKNECEKFTLENLDYLIKKVITLSSYIDYNVNPKIIVDVLTNELRSYYARGSTGKAARSR